GAAGRIDDERSGKGSDSGVVEDNVVGSHGDGVGDSGMLDESLYFVRIILLGGQRDDFQLVGVTPLQVHEIGDFGATRTAPGSPKVQKDDFALGVSERNGFSV